MITAIRRRILDRCILRPTRHPVALTGGQRIDFEHDGKPLEAFFHRGIREHHDVSPPRLIIKFPGTAGRGERAGRFPADLIAGDAWDVWSWNPPGYGGSGHRASLNRMGPAAIDYVDSVVQRTGGQPPIWLLGNSLGCCVAMHVAKTLAAECPIDGIVLKNPPPLRDVVGRIAERYPGRRLMQPVIDSLPPAMDLSVTTPHVKRPLVLVQSGADRLVPPEYQDRVLMWHDGPHEKVVLQGLDHHELVSPEQNRAIARALVWLLERATVSRPL
ncbi:MAG: alpha/beta fold hydrolase [Planctomycetota bacterium]